MVENLEAEDFSCFCKLLVCFCVNVTGFWVAGWVVMGKYDGSGTVCNDICKDFTRMDLAAVHQANGDDTFFNDLVGSVEGYAHKVFLLFIGNIGNERQDILSALNLYSLFEQVSPCQFKGRKDLSGLGKPHPGTAVR